MAEIHASAVIDPSAQLEDEVEIGPYAVIGPAVRIGRGTKVGTHAVIFFDTEMGEGNRVFPFAAIGGDPQDLKYRGGQTRLLIGSRNIFREFVTISRGTEHGGAVTRIGDGNLFMANSHVAHDCVVGSSTIFANSAALAGHVTIEDGAILGGLCAVHQFARVGRLALVGGGAMVSQDVPPFCTASGDRACLHGLNTIGLRRAGVTGQAIRALQETYTLLFRSGLLLGEALERASALGLLPEVAYFIEFIRASRRGVCRHAGAVTVPEGD